MSAYRLHPQKMWTFVKLTRPIFLLGGALLYGLGAAVAFHLGYPIDVARYVLGQVIVTSIQLTAQYANEYHDLECDRLNTDNRTWFSGGSGILPAGEVSIAAARRAIQVFAILGAVSVILAAMQAPLIALIGLLGLLGAWFYSAPPLALMGRGWGELAASLIVALLVPLNGFVMQAGGIHSLVLPICAQLVLVHMAMLIAFEIPDYEADRAVGKRTLLVRLGQRKTVFLHTALLLAAFLLLPFLENMDIPAARPVWFAAPLAGAQILNVWFLNRSNRRRFQWVTLGAVFLFVFTSSLWLIGFLF